jgi:hypothetical protein
VHGHDLSLIFYVFSPQVTQRSAAAGALLRANATESHVAPVAVVDPQTAGMPPVAFSDV